MKKTKICMLLYQYYHLDARVQNYVNALLANQIEVDVICLQHPEQSLIKVDGLRIIELPLQRKSQNRNYFVEYITSFILFFIYTSWNYIKRNGYDIVHIHNMPDFLIFAALILKIFGCKLILDIHDPMPEFFQSKFRLNDKSNILKLLFFEERLSAFVADKVITANENFRQELITRGMPEGKITVISNIANPKIFNREANPKIGHKNFTLVFPGTLASRYGLDIPIKALPVLLKKIPDIHVLLVGDINEYTKSLQRLAKDLAVENYVEILDAVPLEQIPGLLTRGDIGIYPAIPDKHMSIATPGKVLEYAAMGLPVVSSRLKAVTIYLPENCACYFEPGDINGFIDCILELYANPEKVKMMLDNAQKYFVDEFTYEKEQAKYMQLVLTLCNH